MMMKNLWYNLLFVCAVFFSGCTSFLDVVPEDDIETIETDFEKRENAEVWLKSCYVFLTINAAESTGNPAYFGADEFCGGDFIRTNSLAKGVAPALLIGDGLQMAQSPYCNVWHQNQYFAAIRYCNVFLEHIDGVYNMEDDEKAMWKAEIQALKAFYYFDLMRRYGPIILVDKNIETNAGVEEMMQSRRPIDECVDAIVKLCDEAIKKLPYMVAKPSSHSLYFNKEATATLKALALLYAASPLFNGNVALQNFENKNGEKLFPAYDKEKWKRAALACDSAILICKNAGKELISGTGSAPTSLLNTMMDIEKTWIGDAYGSKEAILVVNNSNNYDHMVDIVVPYTPAQVLGYYDQGSSGCLGAPIKMVEMFYTEHGVPITEDKQWMAAKYSMSKEADEKYRNVLPLGTDVLSLHRRREPRFYAMIAPDRSQWYRAYTTGEAVTYKGVDIKVRQGETLGTNLKRYDESVPQNITGYWIKKWLSSDVPLQGYHTYLKNSLQTPRYIFRLAELYLAAAEAWNEYLDVPDARVYDPLDIVRKRAGIDDVRLAWQAYAKNPGKVITQAGMREIIQQEWNIEFAFEGRRYWNVRRWMTAPVELNAPQYGWNVLSSTERGFYCDYDQPMVVWKKRKFEAPKDYFTPIRSEDIQISNIVQNPGW